MFAFPVSGEKLLLAFLLPIPLFLSACASGGTNPVSVSATITSVAVSCSSGSISTSQTTTCKPIVSGTGNYDSSVKWSVSPQNMGAISSAGLFTPIGAGTAKITATSAEDSSKSGDTTVVVDITPTIASVSVVCSATSISADQTSNCAATVQGTGNASTAVTWSVTPTAIGTISNSGVFTSSSEGTATITATSSADSTKSGSATVAVTSSTGQVGPTPAQFEGLLTTSTDYTCAGTVPCATWPMPPMPAPGQGYADPTWGTTTYRLATPAANTKGIVLPAYSRVQAWNSDNTLMFMMDAGSSVGVYMDLYDATTTPPTPINRITISDGIGIDAGDSDALWAFTDPQRIYYVGASSTGHGLELRYVDVSACTPSNCVLSPHVVHTFSCTTDSTSSLGAGVAGNKIETGSGAQGGMFDSTDRYFSFTCDKIDTAGRHEIDFIRYDRQTDTTTHQDKWYKVCPGQVPSGCKVYNALGKDANLLRMNQHPDSRFITVIWQTMSRDADWTRGSGTEVFDPSYKFVGVASAANTHQDVGFDVNGIPVWVGVGSARNDVKDERAISITDLTKISTTGVTYKRILLPCSYSRQTQCDSGAFLGAKSGASHISMTGSWGSLPGYGLFSTMMLAGPYRGNAPDYPAGTTLGTAISGPGTFTVTPGSMSQIGVGVSSTVDTGANMETVKWTAVTGTTATAIFAKPHASSAPVKCLSCGDTGFGAMENLAVKIDTTVLDNSPASFYRVGRTMAIRDNWYNAEPHTAVNRDFTQMIFGSSWNVDCNSNSCIGGYWLKLPGATSVTAKAGIGRDIGGATLIPASGVSAVTTKSGSWAWSAGSRTGAGN